MLLYVWSFSCGKPNHNLPLGIAFTTHRNGDFADGLLVQEPKKPRTGRLLVQGGGLDGSYVVAPVARSKRLKVSNSMWSGRTDHVENEQLGRAPIQ